MTVAITGVTGFIGRHLMNVFVEAGWNVVGLCRNPEGQKPVQLVSYRRFDLASASAVQLAGVDCLIHCALEPYHTTTDRGASINVDGSRALFQTARSQGVTKIAFLSSTASRAQTHSQYGREKYAIEALLEPGSDLAVRPGLVVGDGGLFGAMYRSLRKLRAAPLFLGGQQPVYTVGVQDLAEATFRLVASNAVGTYILAAAEPVTMKSLYEQIARKAGVNAFLIPLPYRPMLFALGIVERFGLTLPISTGSLKGVASMMRMDVPNYQSEGIIIQPFSAALENAKFSA